MNALAYAVQLLGALPALLAAGKQINDLLVQGHATLERMQAEGRDPTPAEWDDLNDAIAVLRQDLHGN